MHEKVYYILYTFLEIISSSNLQIFQNSLLGVKDGWLPIYFLRQQTTRY